MSPDQNVQVEETAIPGMLELILPVHEDSRGWFKENWQKEKMVNAGLPDFHPVQNNVSFNTHRGTTRGLHAEPWDKYISVLSGKIFGAWVDLRPGPSFGIVHTAVVGPDRALFIPRGVANGFQTLEDQTVYSYLVTEHWTEHARSEYSYVNLADPELAIDWPIALSQAVISAADKNHPLLDAAKPVLPKKIAVLGGNGQLGRALAEMAVVDERLVILNRDSVDLARSETLERFNWGAYSHIINAAAMTAVDEAELPQGRRLAWQVNALGVAKLAKLSASHGVKLVHISTDYVFDGVDANVDETHPVAPLSAYGQSKAAGETAVLAYSENIVVRTSWVVGEGKNFVRTMLNLAANGNSPTVIADQYGRPTFTSDLASCILHLIDTRQLGGIYHVQGSGDPVSWYELARSIFDLSGNDPQRVRPISTGGYALLSGMLAKRPEKSTFDMRKIRSTGFVPGDFREQLRSYVRTQEELRVRDNKSVLIDVSK